jgi:hypothetical protein
MLLKRLDSLILLNLSFILLISVSFPFARPPAEAGRTEFTILPKELTPEKAAIPKKMKINLEQIKILSLQNEKEDYTDDDDPKEIFFSKSKFLQHIVSNLSSQHKHGILKL